MGKLHKETHFSDKENSEINLDVSKFPFLDHATTPQCDASKMHIYKIIKMYVMN